MRLLLFILAFLFFTGCDQSEKSVRDTAVVQLSVWAHAGQASERRTIEHQLAAFNHEHNDVQITLTFIPERSYNAQVQAAAIAGALPDLLEFDVPYLYNYAWQGHLQPLETLLPQLLQRLAGRVILVHYRNIEQNFIDAACRRLYGQPFIIPIIDTLPIALRLLELRNHTIQPGNLRLFNLRPHFGLPHYKAHNALYDALATAELFLAMAAEAAPSGDYRIGDFINA